MKAFFYACQECSTVRAHPNPSLADEPSHCMACDKVTEHRRLELSAEVRPKMTSAEAVKYGFDHPELES